MLNTYLVNSVWSHICNKFILIIDDPIIAVAVVCHMFKTFRLTMLTISTSSAEQVWQIRILWSTDSMSPLTMAQNIPKHFGQYLLTYIFLL